MRVIMLILLAIMLDIAMQTWYYRDNRNQHQPEDNPQMPRKPKPPPAMAQLQGLSDGIDQLLRDDMTHEVIPQPNARAPRLSDPQALRDQMNQARLARAQALLVRVGLGAGEAHCAAGEAHRAMAPAKPLRRL